MTPDVLVAGAGPAGSITALLLARAGVRVRMVDRARFPRPKLCGDTLNPGALAILDALDGRGIADRVRARSLPIAGMTVTGPGGAHVDAPYPRGLRGMSLERRDLDSMLVDAAAAAGVTFEDGVSVLSPIVSAEGVVTGARVRSGATATSLSARLVIAADGRGSRLTFPLGLSAFASRPRRWAFGAYYSDVAGVADRGEMHLRSDGYIGIAPVPGGAVNVCVVREIRAGVAGALEQRRVIADAIAADPVLNDRFATARQVSDVVALGPLAIDARAAGRTGLLPAGDAAGFIDPMTGDGLRFAFRGAVLAAEAALAELATGRAGWRALHRARAREFAGKWRMNRALRLLAGSPRALDAGALLSRWWDLPVRYLVAIAGDTSLVPRIESGRAYADARFSSARR